MSIQVSDPLDVSDSINPKAMDLHRIAPPLYLSQLACPTPFELEVLGADTTAQLQCLRDRAFALAAELTLPTPQQEEWRFTDLAPLRAVNFQDRERSTLNLEAIADFILPEVPLRLVFVNGDYAPELSALSALPSGLRVGNLAHQTDVINANLGQQPGAEEGFTTLNTASFGDAAVIQCDRPLGNAPPIHLLWITTAAIPTATTSAAAVAPTLISPRCLIVVAPGSTLTLIEEYVSLGLDTDLINAVTEIWVKEKAQVNHTRIQRQSHTGFHIGKTAVSQGRESRYTCHAISLGGRISRHNLEVHSLGVQTETCLNGLTLATGQQLADTHSAIAFSQPHCTSDQLHKCIVSDRGRGVFNGKISVPKAAQLTQAAQMNRNLLLSPKARIDTKPQLEIVADDVKCAHGATVSQLDTEEIFYLQSRGLDYASACNLLVEGFAVEMLSPLPSQTLQRSLSQLILSQIRAGFA
jgi:Fe-S cluster assembly protein SufD